MCDSCLYFARPAFPWSRESWKKMNVHKTLSSFVLFFFRFSCVLFAILRSDDGRLITRNCFLFTRPHPTSFLSTYLIENDSNNLREWTGTSKKTFSFFFSQHFFFQVSFTPGAQKHEKRADYGSFFFFLSSRHFLKAFTGNKFSFVLSSRFFFNSVV